ncbi:unnamed protein product, partial [Meganyctiphanes norvegica]
MGSLLELQDLLVKRDEKIRQLEAKLKVREDEIVELKSQLDKFQSIMPFATGVAVAPGAKGGRQRKQRAQGISAEPQSLRTIQELACLSQTTFPEVPKSTRSKELLRQAVLENDFLKNLEMGQVMEIVESMYSVEYAEGALIIKEGDIGSILYIMEG